jgi:enamine deaminase RidA (YjgF/YER057c/UK114 family)
MKRRNVYTGKPVEKKYQYTPAVIAEQAGLVFVSGQAGWDENGDMVGIGDPAVQARKAFENLRDVLAVAGASLGSVITETEYVTDLALYREIGRVRKDFFPDNFPAATLVEVKGLFKKGQVFEIDVVALLG